MSAHRYCDIWYVPNSQRLFRAKNKKIYLKNGSVKASIKLSLLKMNAKIQLKSLYARSIMRRFLYFGDDQLKYKYFYFKFDQLN